MALVLVTTFPPGMAYWFLIHPFIRFWRTLGSKLTFLVVAPVVVSAVIGLVLVRKQLLSIEFGANYWLWLPAGVLFVAATWIEVKCRKHLKFRILAGVPELEARGSLLTEGIYSKIRHPRYVAILLALPAWALVTNYFAVYILSVLIWLAILTIVRLEERELAERFGEAYGAYSAKVPRFVPNFQQASN